ncbi:SDR family NAD(P)-dependent oxidoreductase [Companilactobacillus nantensis]|uniref:Short-chain dehydrogenase oxidoreductase n=1 Tax=Companilactobacillus nantensis DSM 16982 TaxID=1423774 RepID=A0A0R1WIX4_9LACO|nr:SDR family NAD(P)-dependent oxidoreductase [Companilactobacillus nantensis]KRM17808.1 short-chain dehydrogenase oxidoreductase [Companilactobacillus nantensis DSM 16982]GEO63507.1 short-chain dehydrogenase/reductase [Companilactobacillus nantensis]
MTKTWMITGTSSGFGKELAQIVAKQADTNLVATARKTADLDYLDAFDTKHIDKVIMDVTDETAVQAGVAAAKNKFGGIDVLVNNAGLGYFGTIEESNEKDVRKMFEVNVFGLGNVTKAVLPIMRSQKQGLIVNISSALGVTSLPTLGWYSATKFAVEGYSNALRQEVAPLGIQVMNVEPSGARTKWNAGKTAPVEIADYSKFADMVNGASAGVTQAPGNPELIAETIYDFATNHETVPEHLPLGTFATDGIKQELTNTLKDVDEYHDISVGIDK